MWQPTSTATLDKIQRTSPVGKKIRKQINICKEDDTKEDPRSLSRRKKNPKPSVLWAKVKVKRMDCLSTCSLLTNILNLKVS